MTVIQVESRNCDGRGLRIIVIYYGHLRYEIMGSVLYIFLKALLLGSVRQISVSYTSKYDIKQNISDRKSVV